MIKLKFVLLGDAAVGKSSIANRFAGEESDSAPVPTVGVEFKVKHTQFNGNHILVQLWDTAGLERFR